MDEFFIYKCLIAKYNECYEVALIFQGLQLRNNEDINDELHVKPKNISMIILVMLLFWKSKIWQSLNLPDNYDNSDGYNDLKEQNNKYSLNIHKIKLWNELIEHDMVYDEEVSLWFYYNIHNIRIISKTPYI